MGEWDGADLAIPAYYPVTNTMNHNPGPKYYQLF